MMEIGLQQLLCLTSIAIACLASSSAGFECYHCRGNMPSSDPDNSPCSDGSFPSYKKRCNDIQACVRLDGHIGEDDGMTKFRFSGCPEELPSVIRTAMLLSSTVDKDKCSVYDLGLLGKATWCVCWDNLCNSATSKHLNNLMKIMSTLLIFTTLRKFY